MRRLVVDAAAELDLRAAIAFYEGQAQGLGSDFVTEAERVYERIADTPDAGSPFGRSHHRYLLLRFPYRVIYRRREGKIVVVAIMHHRRRPGSWAK